MVFDAWRAARDEQLKSCDRARRVWFSSDEGEPPSRENLRSAGEIREDAKDEDSPRGEAVQVAHLLQCYFGWPMFEGVVLDEDGAPARLHAWNLLPDGRILDAAGDLHGGSVLPLGPADEAWRRYRKEWSSSYNPGLATRFPELSGCFWLGHSDIVGLQARREAENEHSGPAMR